MWTKFEDLLKSLGPMIAMAVMSAIPGAAPFAPLVISEIGNAETLIGSGSGPDKRAAVVSAVTEAVTAANTAKGVVLVDPTLVGTQAGTVADLTIGIIKDVQTAQAAVTAK